jgi:hypothetical protein
MHKQPVNKKKSGPVAEVLVIEDDWREAMKKALHKKRPVDGWPKPEPKRKKS